MTSDQEGRGYLYPNQNRRNDKDPTHTGEAVILGHRVSLAGWVDTSRKGTKYLSVKLTDKGVAPEKPPEQTELPEAA